MCMKWFLGFLFLFFIPIVLAEDLEYNIGTITDCSGNLNVKVNGILPINTNEYDIRGCNIIGINEWDCPCGNLVLATPFNTLNNYTFTINYLTQTIEEDKSKSRSSSRGSGYVYYNNSVFINPSIPVNTSNITYPYYNVTNEYKTVTYQVNPQPKQECQVPSCPVVNNPVPVEEEKQSVWQRFWIALKELLETKLW